MTVVWCDTFVFLTIGGGQPGGNKKYETKKKQTAEGVATMRPHRGGGANQDQENDGRG